MIEQNRNEFTKTNILQWWDAGYTGKGINIAVYDSQPALYGFMRSYASIPCDEDIDRDVDKRKLRENGHCISVTRVIHEVAPDAQIFLLDGMSGDNKRNAAWIADPTNGIDLIACSITSRFDSDKGGGRWEIIRDSGIPIFCATGNATEDEVDYPARFDWAIAVGAVVEATDKKAGYANYGQDLDCMGYTSVYVPTSNGGVTPFTGTSCAAPFACGVFALYAQWRKEQGLEISREAVQSFLRTYAQDMEKAGWDERTGYGLICLPPEVPEKEEEEEMQIILTVGSDTALVDGKEVSLLCAPLVVDGRTYLPVRDMGNLFGCQVDWKNETKQVVITK